VEVVVVDVVDEVAVVVVVAGWAGDENKAFPKARPNPNSAETDSVDVSFANDAFNPPVWDCIIVVMKVSPHGLLIIPLCTFSKSRQFPCSPIPD